LFVYLHYFDPHWPYNHRLDATPPSGLAAADRDPGVPELADDAARWVAAAGDGELRRRALDYLAARYALEVRWIDAAIGELIDLLGERGLWNDTVLVLTSDHGEGFWEHERLQHGHAPYEEQIRVPLLVRVPPAMGLGAGPRHEVVSLIDVMPTTLELAGLPIPPHCRGRSLLRAMRGEEDEQRAVLVETTRERVLRTRDAKLLVGRGGEHDAFEYYDLAADPRERSNLASPCEGPCRESVRRLQELESALQPASATEAGASPVTPEEMEELRALGYVGDGSGSEPHLRRSPPP
jgi:arylsulfatase A-like enzyme